MGDYPEHEKLRAVRDQADAVGAFLEWQRSEETPYVLATWETQMDCTFTDGRWDRFVIAGSSVREYRSWHCRDGRLIDDDDLDVDHGECRRCGGTGWVERLEPRLVPAGVGIEALLAEYLNIDLQRIAEEKDEMLRRVRAREVEVD